MKAFNIDHDNNDFEHMLTGKFVINVQVTENKPDEEQDDGREEQIVHVESLIKQNNATYIQRWIEYLESEKDNQLVIKFIITTLRAQILK